MGVELRIDNAEAHALAESIARETGDTIDDAVIQSLRQRLDRIYAEKRFHPSDAVNREAAFYVLIAGSRDRWPVAMLSLDHGDVLYDDIGMPR